jgi:SNF2-related domain
MQSRNRMLLDELGIVPARAAASRFEADGGVPLGFSGEANSFVGELPHNVQHFQRVLLRFCYDHDLTPGAVAELPALQVLLGRLQPRTALAAGTSEAPTCRRSAALRLPLLKSELKQWAAEHLAGLQTVRDCDAVAPAATALQGAADTAVHYSHLLLHTLGLRRLPEKAPAPPAKPGACLAPTQAAACTPSATRAAPPACYRFPALPAEARFDAAALAAALRGTAAAHAAAAAVEPVPLSAATLVVVPGILVEHWKHEAAKHVRHAALRVYCIEDARDANIPAHRLAWDFDLVLTTFSHLSAYGAPWQLRSREARHVVLQARSLHACMRRGQRTPRCAACRHAPRMDATSQMHACMHTYHACRTCARVQVHWLRVILDEGHILGRAAQSNRLALLCALRAERRWVMTGTPAPQAGHHAVAALAPLLAFLHVEPYAGAAGARLWDAAVCMPLEVGRAPGALPLHACMPCHACACVGTPPRPGERPRTHACA